MSRHFETSICPCLPDQANEAAVSQELPSEKNTALENGQTAHESQLQNELLTVSQVATLLQVPASWVYERTRRTGTEQIPHIKLGKYLRFRHAAIEKWLEGFVRI
jgi:excisionase family DNA binding protein